MIVSKRFVEFSGFYFLRELCYMVKERILDPDLDLHQRLKAIFLKIMPKVRNLSADLTSHVLHIANKILIVATSKIQIILS